MLEEIRQQPEALEKTLRSGLSAAKKLAKALAKARPRLIVLVARGTSDNAAQFGRYLLEIMTGIPVSLAAPSITTLYHASLDLRDALVIAISQSGESTDTNMVLANAKQQGALTVGITNESNSALANLAEHVLLVKAGKERSVAATKTYTGQLLMLYLVAHALGARIDLDDLRSLPEWTAAALTLESSIRERAERYRFMERAVVLGRGLNYANTFEFRALKLMETCYIVAERFSTADFSAAPSLWSTRLSPLFAFAVRSGLAGCRRSSRKKPQALGEALLITDAANRDAIARHPGSIVIPARLCRKQTGAPPELFTPIPYIVPAQLFAASLASVKSLDADRPRTLGKVTRTL